MQWLMGFIIGSLQAFFFTALGMAIQRKIDGTDGEDDL